MCKKKINKIIAITGVVGTIVSIKVLPVYATTNTNGITVTNSGKGQVINVTSTWLRIRESASTEAKVLGTMKNGATFDIISKEGKWYKINYNGTKGYVYCDYVKELSQTTDYSLKGVGKVHNISTNLRVRGGASLSSSIIGYLTNDSIVSIVETNGEWYRIQFGSTYGYVHKDYILVEKNANNDSVIVENTENKNQTSNTTTNSNENNSNVASKKGKVYNVVGSSLRVRKGPSTSSNILGSLNEGASVNIIGEEGNFYKIDYNGLTAYVHKDYVKVVSNTDDNQSSNSNNSTTNNSSSSTSQENIQNSASQKGRVINISSNLRVRQKASTNSMVLGYLLNNQSVDIIAKEGAWYRIIFNGVAGYVSQDYIKIVTENDSNASVSNAYDIILNEMKIQIGAPYVWGGSGEIINDQSIKSFKSRFPNEAAQGKYDYAASYIGKNVRAFDCSGLMQWGFAKAGIKIGRSTYEQINNGVEVSISNVKPGDLLFSHTLGHVGMYVGDGKWIESPNTGKNIRIVDVPWSTIGRVRRIL